MINYTAVPPFSLQVIFSFVANELQALSEYLDIQNKASFAQLSCSQAWPCEYSLLKERMGCTHAPTSLTLKPSFSLQLPSVSMLPFKAVGGRGKTTQKIWKACSTPRQAQPTYPHFTRKRKNILLWLIIVVMVCCHSHPTVILTHGPTERLPFEACSFLSTASCVPFVLQQSSKLLSHVFSSPPFSQY